MSDYISRASVLQILSDKNAAWNAYSKVLALPAADVQEVKRGKWKVHYPLATCSVCGNTTIIVLLLISSFILVSICLTYCGAPMLSSYIFMIVISSPWIYPLIIM